MAYSDIFRKWEWLLLGIKCEENNWGWWRFFGTLWSVVRHTRFSMKSLRTLFKHLCQFCHECSSLFCFLLMAEVRVKKHDRRMLIFSVLVLCTNALSRVFSCDFFLNTALNSGEMLDRVRSRPGLWIGSTRSERRVHRIFYCLTME